MLSRSSYFEYVEIREIFLLCLKKHVYNLYPDEINI